MTGDFTMYENRWGSNICFSEDGDLDFRKSLLVYGHHTPIPKVGQTLVCEMRKSWVKFRVERVVPAGDPADMFWADVRAIEQKPK